MDQGQDHDSSGDHEGDLIAAAERDACEYAAARAESLPPAGSVPGYEILRELGRGGMGVVYEAEQEHPKRLVALKVVRGGHFVDDHHVRLFRREERTLARLKHAHIAAIYEGGRTSDGQHFFAMELVHGAPLNDYVRGHGLDARARLELFQKICSAINYAHQRGVIHRDLKPSNILIDAEGNPKILDFGLAKITDSDVAATTVATEIGKIQGTLPYMSPEQARGNPDEIDLRSDVYSLGVILYELLTDQLPYDVNRVALPEAVRVLCDEPPLRPSTINRTLRGDQETIALKALEKDPSRRYQSASALGEDVERYLTNQPILAHPPSAIYRFGKFARRNKTAAASTVIVVLTLALGFVGTAWQAVRATQEQGRAVAAEQVMAEAIRFLFEDLLTSIHEQQRAGTEVTVRQLLDKASEAVGLEFFDQPRAEAALHETLGNTYRSLELYDDAEVHFRAALAIHNQLFEDDPAGFATAVHNLSALLADKMNYEEAQSLCREALDRLRARVGEKHLEVANVLSDLAELADRSGDFEEAETLWREVLRLRRKLLGEEHVDVADALNQLGWVLQALGESEEAELRSREGLTMLRTLLGPEDLDTIAMQADFAWLLQVQGKYAEAEPLFTDALAIRKKLLGDEHSEVADSLSDLAKLLRDKGDFAAAEPLYRQAWAIRKNLWGDEHPESVDSMNDLARLLQRKGDDAGAEALFRDILRIRRERLGSDHWEVAVTLDDLARSLRWRKEVSVL